jgi:hypothetical protein
MGTQTRWLGALTGVLALGLSPAAAQSVMYLGPQTYQARVGERLRLHVDTGRGLAVQRAEWPTDRVAWFLVRAGGTQQNRDRVQPERAGEGFVTVPLDHVGVTLIGMDAKPRVTDLPAQDFRTLLTAHVGDGAPRTGSVRVRRIESAKTLVRVLADQAVPAHSAIAQSKTGQAAEIRPLADPTMVKAGSDLPVRVYVDGSKKARVRVSATSVAAGKTYEFVTDATGAGHFRVTHPGVWRIEFCHVEPLANDQQADWALYCATLTFQVASEGADR